MGCLMVEKIYSITKTEYELLMFIDKNHSLPDCKTSVEDKRLNALQSNGYFEERTTNRNGEAVKVYELTNKGDSGIQQYLQGLEAIQVAHKANRVAIISFVVSSICSVLALIFSIFS